MSIRSLLLITAQRCAERKGLVACGGRSGGRHGRNACHLPFDQRIVTEPPQGRALSVRATGFAPGRAVGGFAGGHTGNDCEVKTPPSESPVDEDWVLLLLYGMALWSV